MRSPSVQASTDEALKEEVTKVEATQNKELVGNRALVFVEDMVIFDPCRLISAL